MLLMIDNYDSFTYNLVQYFGELGQSTKVVRNDEYNAAELQAMKPDYLVVSPGPGMPQQAGISKQAISIFHGNIPVLGVCLGHQSIGEAFGGKTIHAGKIMHGKTDKIIHDGGAMFANMEKPFIATRYHSLVVDKQTMPDCLQITARTEDGEIMAIEHAQAPTVGVQFHPESIATQQGHQLLKNFLAIRV